MRLRVLIIFLCLTLGGCGPKATPPIATKAPREDRQPLLTEARRNFHTRLILREQTGGAPTSPPVGRFDLVKYPSSVGELSAYVSHISAGSVKQPVLIWLAGGFSNSIDATAWTPGPADNDQSGSAFWQSGLAVMYPSLRGGNDNPGYIENFYGEVEDVLAARDWLTKQPFVDPARIYLGGHSTGGTLALLTAECAPTGRFRGVFAFGPAANVRGYGADVLYYDLHDVQESELRASIRWLEGISSLTFVFEGTGNPSNTEGLQKLKEASHNPNLHFYPVQGATHFSILRPLSRLVARKIQRDTGTEPNLAFTEQEANDAMHQP